MFETDFDCYHCNDTGFTYSDNGDRRLCSCWHGQDLADRLQAEEIGFDNAVDLEDLEVDPFDRDGWDDEDAFTSAGWGTDESYDF